jgi:class 3 adenylate cyclase
VTAEFGYLRTSRGAIAYERSGSGDLDIVWASTPLISIETRFENPASARWRQFLESLGRLVVFDFRGFGISEHLAMERVGNLEELAFDIHSVASCLSRKPPILVATTGATMPALSVMASDPATLDRAVLLNAAVRSARLFPVEEYQRIADEWGTGSFLSGAVNPDLITEAQRRHAVRGERIGATPTVIEAFLRNQRSHDVSAVLKDVRTPVLVIHTGDIVFVTAEMCEEVAVGLPNATFLARPSTLFNWGDWQEDLRLFITGGGDADAGYRDLAAVVFVDVVGSTEQASRMGDAKWQELLGFLDAFVERESARGGGRVVKQTGDGHLLEFARPGDAVTAADALAVGAPALGLQIRVGVHYGEIERRPNGDLGGIGVHIGARIAAMANGGQVLVSRTVAELIQGSHWSCQEYGVHALKGVPGSWSIYALER